MRVPRIVLAGLVGTLVACVVAAQGLPTTINYQGVLTDNSVDRVPVDGEIPMEFEIYGSASGVDLLWSESWASVAVTDGIFSILLGSSGTPIPTSLFTGDTLYLQVSVNGETLDPRTAIGSVGYSDESAQIGELSEADIQQMILPSGAVEYFDLPACPPGWSEYGPSQGRVLVGVALGGTQGGSVGTAFFNEENRAHTHSVGPFDVATTANGSHHHTIDGSSLDTSSNGAHEHTIDPPPTGTNSVSHGHSVGSSTPGNLATGGAHEHTGNPSGYYSADDFHNHLWAYHTAEHEWITYLSSGTSLHELVDWGDGMDTGGAGSHPLSTSSDGLVEGFTDERGHRHYLDLPAIAFDAAQHSHSVTIGQFDLDDRSHSHTVNIGNLTSTGGNNHRHSVDLQPGTTSYADAHQHTAHVDGTTTAAGHTSDALPYIQLLVCKKD